jgi:hypothetical protein
MAWASSESPTLRALQTGRRPSSDFVHNSFYGSSARFSVGCVVRGHNTGLSTQTANNRSRLRTKQKIIARFTRSKLFHFADSFYKSCDGYNPTGISCEVFFEEVVSVPGRVAHGTPPSMG